MFAPFHCTGRAGRSPVASRSVPGRARPGVIADETLGPREAVAHMLHASIDMQTDTSHPRGCLVALSGTVRAPGDDEAAVRRMMAARRAADRAGIRQCVVRGIAAGELPEDIHVDGFTSMIHSFLLGISTQVCDDTPAWTLHAAADALLAGWNRPERVP
nr:TetR family transcriptional regulator C-terminal domain-containing protein [Streptomyces sp. SID4912]